MSKEAQPDPMAAGKQIHQEPALGIREVETPNARQNDGETGPADTSIQASLEQLLATGTIGEDVDVGEVERLILGESAAPPADDEPAPAAAPESPDPAPPAQPKAEDPPAAPAASEPEAEGVLAKDGKNVLPYGVLKGAREQAARAAAAAQQLEQQNKQLLEELAALKAGKQTAAGQPSAADESVMGDDQLAQLLESVPDNIGAALKSLVDQSRRLQQELVEVKSRQDDDIRQRTETTASRVQEAIDQRPLLREWQASEDPTLWQFAQQQDGLLKKLPQWADRPMEERFAEVERIVAMAAGIQTAAPAAAPAQKPSLEAQAAKVVAQKTATAAAVPITHSDLPAGRPAAQSEIERVESLDNNALERLFSGAKSMEDIERTLAKIA